MQSNLKFGPGGKKKFMGNNYDLYGKVHASLEPVNRKALRLSILKNLEGQEKI